LIHVFAYGSNLCTERIRARVGSAVPVGRGYVSGRRLAFHKRGRDGSAKADAVSTGNGSDCVWGVVFSLHRDEKPALDACEIGYDEEEVLVSSESGIVRARLYVARSEVIDTSLKPFSWYHGFVLGGAREHRLPRDYVREVESLESIPDPDEVRHARNVRLLRGASTGTRS
jgi:hypothetical protein